MVIKTISSKRFISKVYYYIRFFNINYKFHTEFMFIFYSVLQRFDEFQATEGRTRWSRSTVNGT